MHVHYVCLLGSFSCANLITRDTLCSSRDDDSSQTEFQDEWKKKVSSPKIVDINVLSTEFVNFNYIFHVCCEYLFC
jgi:hypothetical protein